VTVLCDTTSRSVHSHGVWTVLLWSFWLRVVEHLQLVL